MAKSGSDATSRPRSRPKGPSKDEKRGSEEKRRAILEAATHVFAEKGFRGATLREIASTAGLRSHTHIYWYFRDKTEILVTALREGSEAARIPSLDELCELPIARGLERVARAYLRAFDSPRTQELFQIVLSEAARYPEVREEFGKTVRTTTLDVLTELLAFHAKAGHIRAPRPRALATAFWGQLVAFVAIRDIVPNVAGALPGLDVYVDEIVEIFLEGLRPRDAAK